VVDQPALSEIYIENHHVTQSIHQVKFLDDAQMSISFAVIAQMTGTLFNKVMSLMTVGRALPKT
jgi:hypothetical protein